jgi:hypothetical protein
MATSFSDRKKHIFVYLYDSTMFEICQRKFSPTSRPESLRPGRSSAALSLTEEQIETAALFTERRRGRKNE